jgi:hypothetical protein
MTVGPADLHMARAWEAARVDTDGDDLAGQLARSLDFVNAHHDDWRDYYVAWKVVRAVYGGQVP